MSNGTYLIQENTNAAHRYFSVHHVGGVCGSTYGHKPGDRTGNTIWHDGGTSLAEAWRRAKVQTAINGYNPPRLCGHCVTDEERKKLGMS